VRRCGCIYLNFFTTITSDLVALLAAALLIYGRTWCIQDHGCLLKMPLIWFLPVRCSSVRGEISTSIRIGLSNQRHGWRW